MSICGGRAGIGASATARCALTASVVERVAPSRLRLDWFPGSPKAPTSVEIGFLPEGTGTRVTIVHRPLSADANAIWAERVATFAGGWDAVLPALAAFVANKEDD
jgi:uncharacterized protein YndB with AHSA1/START domain